VTVRSLGPARVSGSIVAPPSKSYTHRALVVAFLSGGEATIEHPLASDDTLATRAGVRALGRSVDGPSDRWKVRPAPRAPRGGAPVRIDCGRSGTTLRFLAAVAATLDREVILDGAGELATRPIEPLLEVLEAAGACLRRARSGRSLPLSVRGPMRPVDAELDASVSSQFLSALLLVLPTLDGDSSLTLKGPAVSGPYVEATLDAMARSGVRATVDGPHVTVPGGQRYRAGRLPVPGDASSASYLWAAGAVSGGEVEVRGVPHDRPQADLAILRILESMGASLARSPDGATTRGGPLTGTEVELTDAPDLYPLVGVLAAMASGESRLSGASHVVHKESDRRRATVELARALGARVTSSDGALVIRGNPQPRAIGLRRCADHRVVMSAAVGALAGSGRSTIGDAKAVTKSFPGFWDALRSIGAPSRVARP
jgi:3-phosphoshikimate 1-carboxyvinyltransferase